MNLLNSCLPQSPQIPETFIGALLVTNDVTGDVGDEGAWKQGDGVQGGWC